MPAPKKTRVYVSFDYDHDRDLKTLLINQAKNEDSPFFVEDHSIKVETKGWKDDARTRIRRSDVMIVICGHHTDHATGVAAEVEIARDEGRRFYLLKGRKEGPIRRPKGTFWFFDEVRPWSWEELERMTDLRPWWMKLW